MSPFACAQATVCAFCPPRSRRRPPLRSARARRCSGCGGSTPQRRRWSRSTMHTPPPCCRMAQCECTRRGRGRGREGRRREREGGGEEVGRAKGQKRWRSGECVNQQDDAGHPPRRSSAVMDEQSPPPHTEPPNPTPPPSHGCLDQVRPCGGGHGLAVPGIAGDRCPDTGLCRAERRQPSHGRRGAGHAPAGARARVQQAGRDV